ncbi:FAD:protein FMN transferase [Hyphomicrobium sp.]|uniref:FAD:protein FMN transferase n=1 Tax=Hyphomicrobium sp. TaxID=82 RepID=UPI002E32F7B0|nr:FAD:protein FMN transferase [Hyphomicrobium sp.]HEX2840880.1 FAD:protein FMN transferase [Hyphomicrobium sp.]
MSGAPAQRVNEDERRVLIPERVALPPSFAALRVLRIETLGGETMGTTWSAKIAVPAGTDLSPLRQGIEAVLARIIDEMSPWEPASHITRFNTAAAGTWHRLPDGFFKVLSAALDWAERSGGAYDPTLGASVKLWGFGPGAQRSGIPDTASLEQARAQGGWQRVLLDGQTASAYQPGGLHLDLSSIAKGFAVDEVIRHLQRQGIANMLVEIGGELRGEGLKPDGTPWWIELERPRGAQNTGYVLPDTVLALSGLSVATSGDERRYFDVAGRRYSHTLDPRTGAPIVHDLVSVTIVAADCMTADALATVLTVLGPEAAPVFAAENGIAARFVRFDAGHISEDLSPALAAMLD